MISDFSSLNQKVHELAELAHFLRRENASLRAQLVTLSEQNTDAKQRMQMAHERVETLLARIPNLGADADVIVTAASIAVVKPSTGSASSLQLDPTV